jgi:predicted ArsR family transcriptional regulator
MTAPGIGHRILALLDEHESLAYEQIAAHLNEPPDDVRDALSRLRGIGLVEALAAGELHAHTTRAVAYWRLTHVGREEAARLREQ